MMNRRYSFGHPEKAQAAWAAAKADRVSTIGEPEGSGPWIVTVLLHDDSVVSLAALDTLMKSHGGELID